MEETTRVASPGVKNTVNFFNSLSKSQSESSVRSSIQIMKPIFKPKPCDRRDNVQNTTILQQRDLGNLIPRVHLWRDRDVRIRTTKYKVPYTTIAKSDDRNSQYTNKSFSDLDGDGKPKVLTPDIEAKQILENFTKRISSYCKFEVPVDALSSELLSEVSQLIPDVTCMTAAKKKAPPVPRRTRPSDLGINLRSDAFLESYLQGLGQAGQHGLPSPSPPPVCHLAPLLLPPVAAAPVSRSESRESLIESSGGGSEAGSEDSGDTGYGATCDITLTERLIRSHPIWFLPGIQRAGAFHLLQGKEEGCFVVRQSSQSDTMALSVRLPPDKGPYIEHYLIQSTGGRLGLETSENRFDNMPALVAHYAQCCDELPVQLSLPKAIREAKSRQQLSSLALLGQEFWRYSPPPSAASSPNAELVINLNPLMTTFKSAEPSTPVQNKRKPTRPNTLNLMNKIEPNPQESNRSELATIMKSDIVQKTPPPPPPRWSKPQTPQNNNFTVTTTVTFSVNSQSPSNDSCMQVHCDPKRMSPEGKCTSTISSKDSLHQDLSSKESLHRSPPESIVSPSSVISPNKSIMSPNSDLVSDTLSPLSGSKITRSSKRSKHKVSKHYQESDIVDSPIMYYRSGLGDKISDYEDLWNEQVGKENGRVGKTGSDLASPDLLKHTRNVMSLNNNVLSPSESQQGSHGSHCSTPVFNQNSSQDTLPAPESVVVSPLSDLANISSPRLLKQGSPFYAEPADSIVPLQLVPRRLLNGRNNAQQRHSNPPSLNSHSPLSPLDRGDNSDLNGVISSSVDNLNVKHRFAGLKRPEAKPVPPPVINQAVTENWQVDESWKFMSSECDVNMESSDPDYDSDWPVIPKVMISLQSYNSDTDDQLLIPEISCKRYPDMTSENLALEELSRMSAYDNVDDKKIPRPPPSEVSELTEFSEPWTEVGQGMNTETDDTMSDCTITQKLNNRLSAVSRTKSFKERMDPLLAAPRIQALRSKDQNSAKTIGATIRDYALELAQDKTTTFAQNIDHFICCTLESKETVPQVVMRNMRQFMSGMKNYLVKHGEKDFDREIDKERTKLKSTEFLNLDAILEGVMHKLVVKPLRNHLHKLFVDHYTKTGAIRLLADNIQFASTRPILELGIKSKVNLPSESALTAISQYLQRLQAADSPLEKLEFLLAAIATIFNSVKTSQLTGSGRSVTLGADDFLPLFVWVLIKMNFVAAEIEAEYMWGLLHPSLLSGEGGYYLTTLSSAIHVLKNFKENPEENVRKHSKNDSVLKVVVPDELHGSILTKTLPAKPHMTTKEVCKIIAHKARITNPQDYALYRLTDGEEAMLLDNECPQDFMSMGKHTMLAYKRIDAKIAWPKQDKLNI